MPPRGFERGTPGLEIHRLNQFADELFECGAERVKSRPVLILNLFQIHGPLAYLLKTSDETSGLGKKKMQAICSFIKKEALAQMSSCKFCEISKNTFFYRIPLDDCLIKDFSKGRLNVFFLNIEKGEKETKFDF